jgi:GNAT superfamily N-acetyltransferase
VRLTTIDYIEADESWRDPVSRAFGDKAARHMHVKGGFSILALQDRGPVGLISVYWQVLPPPLKGSSEGYIDIIEVAEDFRRQGIAAELLSIVVTRAREQGAYQLRAWSSEDKIEAIPMWKHLGFGLCPAVTYPGGKEVKGYFVTKVI